MVNVLNYSFPFWDALAAVGTMGAVIVALLVPILERKTKKKDEYNQLINNIVNELIIDIDKLIYFGTERREFFVDTEQINFLFTNPNKISLKGNESFYRKLQFFDYSAKFFNERMREYLDIYNKNLSFPHKDSKKARERKKRMHWIKFKLDSIKLVLILLWIQGFPGVSFEKEEVPFQDIVGIFDNCTVKIQVESKVKKIPLLANIQIKLNVQDCFEKQLSTYDSILRELKNIIDEEDYKIKIHNLLNNLVIE